MKRFRQGESCTSDEKFFDRERCTSDEKVFDRERCTSDENFSRGRERDDSALVCRRLYTVIIAALNFFTV